MRSGGGGGGKFVRDLTLVEAIEACEKDVGEKASEDVGDVGVGDDMYLIKALKRYCLVQLCACHTRVFNQSLCGRDLRYSESCLDAVAAARMLGDESRRTMEIGEVFYEEPW